jgi:hypothetical protein
LELEDPFPSSLKGLWVDLRASQAVGGAQQFLATRPLQGLLEYPGDMEADFSQKG